MGEGRPHLDSPFGLAVRQLAFGSASAGRAGLDAIGRLERDSATRKVATLSRFRLTRRACQHFACLSIAAAFWCAAGERLSAQSPPEITALFEALPASGTTIRFSRGSYVFSRGGHFQ